MVRARESLSALEASFLASACLEISRLVEAPAPPLLADLALRFDPERAPVSERMVRKALEEGVVPSLRADRVSLDESAVLYFASTQSLGGALLSLEMKSRVFESIRMGSERIELSPLVSLDLGPLLALGRRVLDWYAMGRDRHISIDPEIMGGVPVIRGTRIPVYTILGRARDGETIAEICADFDYVPREAIETALAHACTHPRRGRPRRYR